MVLFVKIVLCYTGFFCVCYINFGFYCVQSSQHRLTKGLLMVSLVIFFIHGSAFDLKVVTKSTLDNPAIVTIGVYYDVSGGSLQISGSPVINRILANKDTWFDDTSPGCLALFKQLFAQVLAKHPFNSQQIYFYAEGNLGNIGGSHLSPIALELIDYIQPGTAVLPAGTPECNKFIHYWMTYYRYPTLALGEKFEMKTYSAEELTFEKMAYLNAKVSNMSLRCTPPLIATFDKKLISDSVRFLFGISTTPQNHLSHVGEDDNNVYSFLSKMDSAGLVFHPDVIPEHALSFQSSSEDAYRVTQPSSRITTRQLRSDQAQYAIPQNSGSATKQATKAKKNPSYFRFFCCYRDTAPSVIPLTNIENTSTLRDGDNHVGGSDGFGL